MDQGGAFLSVVDSLDQNNGGVFNTMVFGFIQAFDPFSPVSLPGLIKGYYIDIQRTIAGFFLYGCDVFDGTCPELPSTSVNVLSQAIVEDREGNIFLTGKCSAG